MNEYETYIFDLYGTLIDVRTNEWSDAFWKKMANLYSGLGAIYSDRGFKEEFNKVIKEQEERIKKEEHIDYPEVDLGETFKELLFRGEKTENFFEEGNTEYYPVRDLTLLSDKELRAVIQVIGQSFRVISRTKMKAYKDTIPVLSTLKKNGKKIYLLSNAQTILTRPEMSLCGLMPYFDGIYISSEQRVKKPDKEFMEKLIREFSIKRETAVMIGNDMVADMGIAAKCGIDGMFVNTFGWDEKETKLHMKEMWKETGTRMKPVRMLMDGRLRGIL